MMIRSTSSAKQRAADHYEHQLGPAPPPPPLPPRHNSHVTDNDEVKGKSTIDTEVSVQCFET